MLSEYDYKLYLDIYDKLNGKTTHFTPVIGTITLTKDVLSQGEFDEMLNELICLSSSDCDNPDELELGAWRMFQLKSDLFLHEKLHPFYGSD